MTCAHTQPTSRVQIRAACRGGSYRPEASDVLVTAILAANLAGIFEDEGQRDAVGGVALTVLGMLLPPEEYETAADALVLALSEPQR